MTKYLVIFYSLSGNTGLVAAKIAALLHGDSERILKKEPYEGFLGYMRAATHAVTGHRPPIETPKWSPKDYDLVVIAGPIWMGRIAPPVKSYLDRFQGRFKNIAFCVTHGGSSPAKSFHQMQDLSGTSPVATLSVTAKEVVDRDYDPKVRSFVKTLEAAIESDMQDVV